MPVFEKIAGKPFFTVGQSMDVMRQSSSLCMNSVTVYCNCFLLDCMAVSQASV